MTELPPPPASELPPPGFSPGRRTLSPHVHASRRPCCEPDITVLVCEDCGSRGAAYRCETCGHPLCTRCKEKH